MSFVNLVILYSRSRKGEWKPVKPADVPDWVKDPDVIAQLRQGFMARSRTGRGWYRAERMPDSPIIMPAPKLTHSPQVLART